LGTAVQVVSFFEGAKVLLAAAIAYIRWRGQIWAQFFNKF